MLLAEVEIRHSRPVAPTRRVALGLCVLPADPAPGWGGVLLGGIVAANVPGLDDEFVHDVFALADDLEHQRRIAQPRMRYRFQADTVGLDRSRHSLVGEGEDTWFDLDDHAAPEVNILGALYAAATLPMAARPRAFAALRRAMVWERPLDHRFVACMLGEESRWSRWMTMDEDLRWAMRVMGYTIDDQPDRDDVQLRFREMVWDAHPDRGGDPDQASRRMTDLTRARRILLETA
jgi:hypothetical protein